MTDVFTDDEMKILVSRFLEQRGERGATNEEIIEVIHELETLRVGAVMLKMVFDDEIRPDFDGSIVTYSASPNA